MNTKWVDSDWPNGCSNTRDLHSVLCQRWRLTAGSTSSLYFISDRYGVLFKPGKPCTWLLKNVPHQPLRLALPKSPTALAFGYQLKAQTKGNTREKSGVGD